MSTKSFVKWAQSALSYGSPDLTVVLARLSIYGDLVHCVERSRARYSIQYAAPPSDPGAFHRIHVELVPEARLKQRVAIVRARAGYYAAR